MATDDSSSVTPLKKPAPNQSLYDACARFGEIRAELLLVSEVLNDSAFSGSNAITEERDTCAVLVLGKAVEKLATLQGDLDDISVRLAQPDAISGLKEVADE